MPVLAGALAYGQSRGEAIAKAEALALRILAERLEHGEPTPELDGVFEAAERRGDACPHRATLGTAAKGLVTPAGS